MSIKVCQQVLFLSTAPSTGAPNRVRAHTFGNLTFHLAGVVTVGLVKSKKYSGAPCLQPLSSFNIQTWTSGFLLRPSSQLAWTSGFLLRPSSQPN